jgi:hypothetical protein
MLATSTDVERAFSRGGLTVSKLRHSLSDDSTRASTVLGSWGSLEGEIPQEEIVQVFRNKRKRQKKKQKLAEKSSDIEIFDEF